MTTPKQTAQRDFKLRNMAKSAIKNGKVKPPIHLRCIDVDGEVVAEFKMDLNARGDFPMSERHVPHGVVNNIAKVVMTGADGKSIEGSLES
jgi:hypothetical protein